MGADCAGRELRVRRQLMEELQIRVQAGNLRNQSQEKAKSSKYKGGEAEVEIKSTLYSRRAVRVRAKASSRFSPHTTSLAIMGS
jgi:hypothetical protein